MAIVTKEIVRSCRFSTLTGDDTLLIRDPKGKLIDPCETPFSKIQGKIKDLDFRDYLGLGTRILIPKNKEHYVLFGTQPREQYVNFKGRIVDAKLAKCGITCLEENPIPACLVPFGNQSRLAVLDAHHRARNAGKFDDITHLPIVVYAPEVVADIYKRHGIRPVPRDTTDLIALLDQQIDITIESFRRVDKDGILKDENEGILTREGSLKVMDRKKEPHPVQVRNINELAKIFPPLLTRAAGMY